MNTMFALISRNMKLFFKDKGMFFTSLITPVILLVLYVTFLGKVYSDNMTSAFPEGFELSEKLLNGTVACELFSSLLAVCCITVAFCSNMLMVQDKVTGARNDFMVTPVKKQTLAIAYYIATVCVTLIVCLATTGLSFIYVACVGWFLSVADAFFILLDVFLLVLFGTALSSVVNYFLTSQGQISAVGTVVSSGYGFICGAYMPISFFGEGLQKALSFLPGTYGTSLLRNHALAGVFEEMQAQNVPSEVINNIKLSMDCNISFFGNDVSVSAMYIVLTGTVVALIGAYVLINVLGGRKEKKK